MGMDLVWGEPVQRLGLRSFSPLNTLRGGHRIEIDLDSEYGRDVGVFQSMFLRHPDFSAGGDGK